MKIMCLCNSNFSNYYLNPDEDESIKENELHHFIEIASGDLHKKTDRILTSLKARGFIIFDKIYMVKQNKTYCEATEDESKMIDYYNVILREYNLKNKYSIRLNKHRTEIYKKFREKLGFSFYSAIKIKLSENLEINSNYLFHQARLTDKCGFEVNKLICDKVYKLVVDGFNQIRNIGKNINVKQQLEETHREENCEALPETNTVLMQFLSNKAPSGEMNTKFIRKDDFNLDDDFVKRRFEELINKYIRNDDWSE